MIPPEIAPAGHSRADDIVAFVDARQEDVAEVDGPYPIIDLLEADDVLLERPGCAGRSAPGRSADKRQRSELDHV